MSAFDPTAIRRAVAEFTPPQPRRFRNLLQAKDVIAELRQKGATFEGIAGLLTQHCLPTSKTAIAAFCHQMLGEQVRPHKKHKKKRPLTRNGHESSAIDIQRSKGALTAEPTGDANGVKPPSIPPRGPRIAQVRMLNPQNK
jgi:hypothetical protein